MNQAFVLDCEPRKQAGKGAARRLRRLQQKVPGIIYGAAQGSAPITVTLKDLAKHLESEAFYSHILALNLEGQIVKAVLKDLQRHPATSTPMHVDFLRVDETHKIRMHVPLHFTNEDKCIGVKAKGGVIAHQLTEVEVTCLPKDLPEYIEVDMTEVDINQIIHLSDLKLPEGVTLQELLLGKNHDLTVATVHLPKGATAEEEAQSAEEKQE